MKKFQVVADDQIPFLRGVLEASGCDVRYLPVAETTPEAVRDTDAILTRTRTRCTESLLKGSNVSFIGTATIGFDHIDVDYCAKNGILWANAPGCNAASVGQYIASSLALLSDAFGFSLRGKKIAVVGVGNTGKAVLRFALAAGMEPLWVDPPRALSEGSEGFLKLEEALALADIVTLHVPNNPSTRYMANPAFFDALKPGAFFLNAARGKAVCDEALNAALDSGKVRAAVLDVWDNEPDFDPALFKKAFLATPHIAGYSLEGKWNGTRTAVRAFGNHFKLGLENWNPEPLPPPEIPFLDLASASEMDTETVLKKALIHAYDPRGDGRRLRAEPHRFEALRWEYPPRREWEAFTVRLSEGHPAEKVLRELGFTVQF